MKDIKIGWDESNIFEFEPGINRDLETYSSTWLESIIYSYPNSATTNEYFFEYTCNLNFESTTNVTDYSVYINDNYYGDNVTLIQVNNGDMVKIDIVAGTTTQIPEIVFSQRLI